MELDNYSVSVISAAIGAMVAIFTNFWRTRYTIKAQDFSKRIEEISTLIGKLEVLVCEYWCSRDEVKPSGAPYILGMQEKINILLDYLNNQYQRFDQESISGPLAEFVVSCTGDSFDSKGGISEPQRIRQILVSGEILKIELMKIRNTLY